MHLRHRLVLASLILGLGTTGIAVQDPAQPAPTPPPQQSDIELVISGDAGAPPKYAVPNLIAVSGDAESKAAAQTIGQVLWDDLNFEREFYMIPPDPPAPIPHRRPLDDVPFDRGRELGSDGIFVGTVQKEGTGLRIQVRLFNVRSRQVAFSREYTGSAGNPRAYAHTMADEIHQHQRALRGVARTKLTFSSDRDREKVTGTVENRDVKEIYISDYDGANQRRITVNRALNITPTWAPDGRSIAYTSYARGFPTLFISFIYEGRRDEPTKGGTQNWLPAWSPDGTKIAFTSNRHGNPELYVMNRDGSGLRRLTNHPSIDTTPTWSPTGTQIALTSDRSGGPAIYIVGADGLNLRRISRDNNCDRATWSPAPFNEIAFVCRTGPGYDVKIYEFQTDSIRQITFGEGSNESPAYAPNGKHLAFTSTRAGKTQIFTVARDGKNVRQITRVGNNFTPDWSH